MKIIKYVFLLILLAFIALAVFIATQEGKYDIKRERIINVPRGLLFDYINDYRNWENVGILTNNDSSAVFAYTPNTAGKGAVTTWKLNGTTGRVETIKVVENDSIIQKAVIDDKASDIAWGFAKAKGGTKISLRMKGELSFTDKANAVFKGGVREKLEESLDRGLNGLNAFLVHELNTYTIETKGMVNKMGTFYLCQTVTSQIPEMNRKVTEILPKLLAFIKENNIARNGNPFSLYKKYDKANNTTTFSVCVPIKEEIFTSPGSEIEGGRLQPFSAFKTSLKGDYSHLPQAWTQAHKAIAEKGLYENTVGQYIEVYTRNVNHTKKPSQWVTDIYIPIGPAAVPMTGIEGEEQAATSAEMTKGISKPTQATPIVKAAAKPAAGGTTKPTGSTTTPKPTGITTTPKPKPSGTTTPQ